MPLPLEDYALIGDTHTAALVGRDGSIDWLCLPRFDSGACFAALLGDPSHGRWSIAPTEPFRTRRRYRPDTLVLDTEHETASGTVRVTDFMTPRRAQARVVRIVEGRPRRRAGPQRAAACASTTASRSRGSARCRRACARSPGPDAVHLRTEAPIDVTTGTVASDFMVRAGQRVSFVLTWHRSYEPVPAKIDPLDALRNTVRYWTRWSARCEYRGEWRDAVMRSLITLKALTYRPTGGIVAAPTTSLPEELGGARNWDYRFCWLRDATFTLYSLLMAGYDDEAEAWREWLLRAVAGDPRDLRIMYGIARRAADPRDRSRVAPGLRGVAAGAGRQRRVAASSSSTSTARCWTCCTRPRARGSPHESAAWEMELRIMDVLESNWREPDEGIWEVRGGRQQFVHSKVMAWVGVDRADPRRSSCSGSTARSIGGARSATRSTTRSAARASTTTSAPSRRSTGRSRSTRRC